MEIILYRKAEPNDAMEIAKTRIGLFAETKKYKKEQLLDAYAGFKAYFSESIANESFVCWVAAKSGRILGVAGAHFFTSPPGIDNPNIKNAFISNVYTYPEFRKQGIAKKLMSLLIKDLKRLGSERILLTVTDSSGKFFEGCGFKAVNGFMVYQP